MIRIASLLVLFTVAAIVTAEEPGAPLKLNPIKSLDLAEGETAYKVDAGEALIDDQIIRRILVGLDEVTVTYRNNTGKRLRPEYKIHLYNRYGLLLAQHEVKSGIMLDTVGRIEPGDVASETLSIDWYPLEKIFLQSDVMLPDDWRSIEWIVISDSNAPSPQSGSADDD